MPRQKVGPVHLSKQCNSNEWFMNELIAKSESWTRARDHVPSQKVGPVYLSSNVVVVVVVVMNTLSGLE